jgi:alpha-amylase
LHNYCGGDFKGVQQQLQYIKDLGFDAIWISPVVDNTDGGYHGYWARNWEKTNSHFGDENALKALVAAAHSMGIWVMVDVVANHVGPVEHDYS